MTAPLLAVHHVIGKIAIVQQSMNAKIFRLLKDAEILDSKCVVLVDGDVLSINTRTVLPYQSMSCVIQDCKHKIYQFDCTFVNGVQCIWGTSGCSKCADHTTYETCTSYTGLCYWANNLCQNVECTQYTSPTSCSLKSSQCEWNQLKMKCLLSSTLTNAWCYSEYLAESTWFNLSISILITMLL